MDATRKANTMSALLLPLNIWEVCFRLQLCTLCADESAESVALWVRLLDRCMGGRQLFLAKSGHSDDILPVRLLAFVEHRFRGKLHGERPSRSNFAEDIVYNLSRHGFESGRHLKNRVSTLTQIEPGSFTYGEP